MGLLGFAKLGTRAKRLYDALHQGAADWEMRARTGTTAHALYRTRHYWTRVLIAVAALVEVLPIPQRWRQTIMGFLSNILKNWKTSLIGLATGAGIAFLTSVQGGMHPRDAALAAGVAALGLAAKDGNVTGGTVKQ